MTAKILKDKKKLLIMLTLLLIPAAALIYWVHTFTKKGEIKPTPVVNAFNSKLPAPGLQQTEKNKLEVYMQAAQDSSNREQAMEKDPYSKKILLPGTSDSSTVQSNKNIPQIFKSQDANEKKVNEHLQRLYAELDRTTLGDSQRKINGPISNQHTPQVNPDIEKLEKLLIASRNQTASPDPELDKLDSMLNKAIEIQPHAQMPRQIADTQRKMQKPIANVTTEPNDTIDKAENNETFLSFTTNKPDKEKDAKEILAIVHDNQTIHEGSTVRLRLVQDIYVNGTLIPKDNFIYGECKVNNERVSIQFQNISFKNSIFPVALSAYDGTDGLAGLYAPGAISRDVAKEGANQAIQGVQLLNADPSITAQAAAAGIETVKSIFGKKVKLIQVTLKAGKIVLLRQTNIN